MRMPRYLLAAAFVLAAVSVYAQDDTPPAHISFVEGTAIVRHIPDPSSSQPDSEPASLNLPIVAGDRIESLGRSRCEVMFPDGGGIAIGWDSAVEFVTATRVRVIAGSVEHLAAPAVDPRSPSTQNLPGELQPYSPEFDQNGSWQYDSQYGNVWYPTTVAADWRPYSDGYWSADPVYGWTWIGAEHWAWPTHHYGRWGYSRSRWFWIPGHSYGSAWVSWGTAPGYVSWCPLGYDGRAVVGLSAGLHNSWNAWTVVPRDRFGARGYSARRYAVEPQRIAASVPFIEHGTPPARAPRSAVSVAGSESRARVRGDGASRTAAPLEGARTAAPLGRATGVVRSPAADDRVSVRPAPADAHTSSDGVPQRRPNLDGRRVTTQDERSTPARVPHLETGSSPSTHPAYQPRYQPRYESTPTVTAPEARPTTQPRRDVRDVAPASPAAAAPPRATAPPPTQSREAHPPAPAHGEHGGENNRARPSSAPSPPASSTPSPGVAVRRPR
jgi:Family of unknown function (DUF6600)